MLVLIVVINIVTKMRYTAREKLERCPKLTIVSYWELRCFLVSWATSVLRASRALFKSPSLSHKSRLGKNTDGCHNGLKSPSTPLSFCMSELDTTSDSLKKYRKKCTFENFDCFHQFCNPLTYRHI